MNCSVVGTEGNGKETQAEANDDDVFCDLVGKNCTTFCKRGDDHMSRGLA